MNDAIPQTTQVSSQSSERSSATPRASRELRHRCLYCSRLRTVPRAGAGADNCRGYGDAQMGLTGAGVPRPPEGGVHFVCLCAASAACWRPRSRERNSAGCGSQGVAGLGRRVENVPLADAITAVALCKVNMDVVLMVAVRAWTDMVVKRAQTDVLIAMRKSSETPGSGGPHDPTTLEPDGANVEGVCPPDARSFWRRQCDFGRGTRRN